LLWCWFTSLPVTFWEAGWPIDGRTYVVIVTRGHRHDEQALHAVIDSPARTTPLSTSCGSATTGGGVESGSQARGIPVTCEADESESDLSRGSALALYRIAQEALGNAAKHAAPTWIEVRLARAGSDALLTVTDDGAGVHAVGVGTGGLGLVSMRERARQLNGTFELVSKPGRGTTISVRIPFRPASTPS